MSEKLLTVTALRRTIQLFAFVFFVYGAYIFNTFYTGDKLTQSLPALSCAYDRQGGDFCTLIVFQHQIDHRVSGVFNGTVDVMSGLMPTVITLATVAVLILVLSKAFCGWMCPLGFFQEAINMIGKKLGFKQTETLSLETTKKFTVVKWGILLFLVLIFPLLTGLGFLNHAWGAPYCSICPSRMLTTLLTGDASQVFISTAGSSYFALSLIADLLFGLMIALALFVRQPFCRICPMLPLQSVFKKIGLLRLVKSNSSHCEGCGQCVKACPMDIHSLCNSVEKTKNITSTDCTLCARCVEFCPHDDVLAVKYAPFKLFGSSKDYFKKRVKIDKWWAK
jgi:ferredoxin-type protein NapH